jgi:hypothetical protein
MSTEGDKAKRHLIRSIVVDYLQGFYLNDNVAIVCIYFSHHERRQHTFERLLANLLKRLIRNRGAVSERIKSLYGARGNNSALQESDEFMEVLKVELMTYSKVFIIIDALDEYTETGGTQANLLGALRELPVIINLMITSRHSPLIAARVAGAKHFDIYAHDEDIEIYTEARIFRNFPHLEEIRGVIVKTMIGNAQGM